MADEIIDALAAYRLTRLAQVDTFPASEALRKFVLEHGSPRTIELFECPWCLGFWISVGTVVARRALPRPWAVVARALAVSAVVGFASMCVERLHQVIEAHHENEEN